jgi:hypothetical protein
LARLRSMIDDTPSDDNTVFKPQSKTPCQAFKSNEQTIDATASVCDSSFAERVSLAINDNFIKPKATIFTCSKCGVDQKLLRAFTQHARYCRLDTATRVRISNESDYRCNICFQKLEDLPKFKSHIFFEHNEMEVKSKYNLTIQRLIGSKYLLRLRAPLLSKIGRGQFFDFLDTMTIQRYGISYHALSYLYTHDMDPD